MCDLLNKEIGELTKQKEIEEMVRDLKNCLPSDWFWLKTVDSDAHLVAKHFYNLGYSNVKDKVMLSKEEQERLNATEKRIKQLKNEINDYKQRYASAEKRYEQLVQSSCEALAKKGKETAREIIAKVKQALNYLDNEWEISNALYQIEKQYGVEVE